MSKRSILKLATRFKRIIKNDPELIAEAGIKDFISDFRQNPDNAVEKAERWGFWPTRRIERLRPRTWAQFFKDKAHQWADPDFDPKAQDSLFVGARVYTSEEAAKKATKAKDVQPTFRGTILSIEGNAVMVGHDDGTVSRERLTNLLLIPEWEDVSYMERYNPEQDKIQKAKAEQEKIDMEYSIGDTVCLRSDPSKVGVVVQSNIQRQKTFGRVIKDIVLEYVVVRFGTKTERIPLKNLKKIRAENRSFEQGTAVTLRGKLGFVGVVISGNIKSGLPLAPTVKVRFANGIVKTVSTAVLDIVEKSAYEEAVRLRRTQRKGKPKLRVVPEQVRIETEPETAEEGEEEETTPPQKRHLTVANSRYRMIKLASRFNRILSIS